MPNVNVLKKELFAAIGKEFTDEEFEDLCFQYGVEVEFGDATEMQMNRVDHNGNNIDISKEQVYKIEVAANRYDMLCLEGIVASFRSYLNIENMPRYAIKNQSDDLMQINVKPETQEVRPFVVGCVLRDITFDLQSYNSFIDLQDKLHQNICRRRTLASMGTHDLSKVKGPVTYEALPPSEIVFQALKQTESMDANALFEKFKSDIKMKKFLPILEGKERYPVFYDADRTVLSLPPIINSEKTKITLDTKDVFVEITGTDLLKSKICLAVLAAQFSTHCGGEWKHHVEQVKINYEHDESKSEVTPSLQYVDFEVEIDYINRLLGTKLDADKIKDCAKQMGLVMKSSTDKSVLVECPPTRGDILHPCDVAEDIGIGFGFNNIEPVYPPTNTTGAFQPINKFSDLLRSELAQAGYIECLTMSLLSMQDNYKNMNMEPKLDECVQLSNPKTQEFEIVRTSLMPGLMKTLQSNKKESLPQKIFEVSDIVVLNEKAETGAQNHRRLCAMVLDQVGNFQEIHGVLDLLMTKVGATPGKQYYLKENNDDTRYFGKRGANIMLNGKQVGSIGVLHPSVLDNFELKYPVCALEVDVDDIFAHFKSMYQ